MYAYVYAETESTRGAPLTHDIDVHRLRVPVPVPVEIERRADFLECDASISTNKCMFAYRSVRWRRGGGGGRRGRVGCHVISVRSKWGPRERHCVCLCMAVCVHHVRVQLARVRVKTSGVVFSTHATDTLHGHRTLWANMSTQ